MNKFFKNIAENEFFQRCTFFLIVLTAVAMGVEAVPGLAERYGDLLYTLDYLVQAAFVIEIAIRLLAHAPQVQRFFHERSNTFDFVIVALSLIPAVGSFALIGRLLRSLRVLRMLSASDYMRGFTARLQQTFDEIAAAAVIVAIVGYIFIIGGHYLFAGMDPVHWGSLRQALMSVFYLMLFQDVAAFVEPLVAQSLFSLLYFIVFYISFIGLAFSVIAAAVLQEPGKDRK